MIISIEEVKKYITTTEPDAVLEAKLQALEVLIRKYTNNNFQNRKIRCLGEVEENTLVVTTETFFNIGDTIMIDDDLATITDIAENVFKISKHLLYSDRCLVTKVEYPMDVKMGVVNMIKWDLENREKVGIQSETISRHSVTYFNMDGDNSTMGFPKSLLGFLKPYMKARF